MISDLFYDWTGTVLSSCRVVVSTHHLRNFERRLGPQLRRDPVAHGLHLPLAQSSPPLLPLLLLPPLALALLPLSLQFLLLSRPLYQNPAPISPKSMQEIVCEYVMRPSNYDEVKYELQNKIHTYMYMLTMAMVV